MAKNDQWLEYDWQLDGEAARFGVELSFYRKAPDEKHPFVCYFCCQRTDEKELTPADLKRIVALIGRCSKKVRLLPAGFVQTGNLRQYYFYTSGKDEYDVLKSVSASEKKLLIRVGGKREDDWATYFKLLYPNEVKLQTVKNREQVGKLRRIGDNLEASRRINLHVSFRTEQQRLLFEETARQAGFAIGGAEYHSEYELPNGTVIYRISTLKDEDIDALTVRTVKLAQKLDGKLVYWDCNIVPKSVKKRI
ncbi:MAG: DUF695 domain-containing protein [Clostridia bacterium]|nr:DUF695 domain-containing protein [Clostridia bacterium]